MALRLTYGYVRDLARRQHQFLGQPHDPNPPLDLEDPPPAGVTHDGTWASTGTSTSTFGASLLIAADMSSAGTSTSTFAGELLGAGPATLTILGRGTTARTIRRGR